MVITLFHPSYHHTLGASGRIAIATKMKLFMCILIIPCAEKYPKLATSVTIALAASIILTILRAARGMFAASEWAARIHGIHLCIDVATKLAVGALEHSAV